MVYMSKGVWIVKRDINEKWDWLLKKLTKGWWWTQVVCYWCAKKKRIGGGWSFVSMKWAIKHRRRRGEYQVKREIRYYINNIVYHSCHLLLILTYCHNCMSCSCWSIPRDMSNKSYIQYWLSKQTWNKLRTWSPYDGRTKTI